MSEELQRKLELPAIDQLGLVVPDMDAALAHYEPLFGPFELAEYSIEKATYRGEEHDCRMKLAFGRSGELEVELIELVEGRSAHSEFIEAGGNGMHHVRFRIADDIDSKIEEAAALGYECIWYKRMAEQLAFAYLQREGDPLVIEFLQMPD